MGQRTRELILRLENSFTQMNRNQLMNDLLGLYVAVFVVLGAGSGADKGLGLWPRIAILPSLVFGFDALVKFQTLSINKPRVSLARVLKGGLGAS